MQHATIHLARPLLLAIIVLAIGYFSPTQVFAADSDGDGIDDSLDNCSGCRERGAAQHRRRSRPRRIVLRRRQSGRRLRHRRRQRRLHRHPRAVHGHRRAQQLQRHHRLDDETIDARPFDTLTTASITRIDILRFVPLLNTFAPGPLYNPRFDLNVNGAVNTIDVLLYVPVLNTTCTPATGPVGPAPSNGRGDVQFRARSRTQSVGQRQRLHDDGGVLHLRGRHGHPGPRHGLRPRSQAPRPA